MCFSAATTIAQKLKSEEGCNTFPRSFGGRDGEWLADATCNRVYAGSIPVPASEPKTYAFGLWMRWAFGAGCSSTAICN